MQHRYDTAPDFIIHHINKILFFAQSDRNLKYRNPIALPINTANTTRPNKSNPRFFDFTTVPDPQAFRHPAAQMVPLGFPL